jgi:protein-disulfide isomerase
MATLKVPVNENDHIQGNSDAPITLLEYGDYECGYCGMAYPIIKRVQKHFADQLRFVFRNFPLTEMHPNAEIAAETAEFAGAHEKFWEMHDLIYENQQLLSGTHLLKLAQTLKLSVSDLEQALRDETFAAKIRADFLSGVKSGVNGTPSFYINNIRHNGSFEFDELVMAINAVIT